ncbi:MAG: alanine/ornithine racemase family PLP-dependent enzyme [Candidatus Aegiribacteria sp.]|nr:alanine/ornithine racemase family PLP-dependent enzyme [Candidatus Aegiribacteria sp.]MBD3294851.1 alanine/ornithine racemase family PLP-dependent enzyme [Candidatus Fermentibacteria bacterium]
MNRIIINSEAIGENYRTVKRWVNEHGATLTVVTKALCGHPGAIESLADMGVSSIADSRLQNLKDISEKKLNFEKWFLRPPSQSQLGDVVALTDVSLNTELGTVKKLDRIAKEQDTVHKVLLMIELGDLREGILPGGLVKLYNEIFHLENIDIMGIGANLGCFSGTVPSVDQLMQLVLYRELLELKFQHKLSLISAGSSVLLPFLLEGQVPPAINHFRVGEAILLGTDLINGGTIYGLRDDAFILEAEIIEMKEKSLTPSGETVDDLAPFPTPDEESEEERTPGQRGYRAVVTVGALDTEVSGLRPVNEDYHIAGASSDVTVLNLGENPEGLKTGDCVHFKMGYSTLVRLMNNSYTEKTMRKTMERESGTCD